MYSDACKNFDCQHPLQLRNRNTGEVFELMCWDWPHDLAYQVAQFSNGDRVSEMLVREHFEVLPCPHCAQEHPAQRWPLFSHSESTSVVSPARLAGTQPSFLDTIS